MSELLKKYTNDQSRFLVIDGAMVHYRDEGEGPILLCLHGAFSSLHTFNAWVEELTDRYRIIRVDLPGFGLSNPSPDVSYSLETYLQFLHKFCDRLDLKDFSIAGSSLGGWLAWEYTLAFPKAIRHLVLIDAAGFMEGGNLPLPFRMARTPFLSKIARYVIKRNVLEVFVKQVYGDPERITDSLIDRYYDLFSREGNPQAFFSLVNSRYKDNTRKLSRIQAPTLILWGDLDSWLPVSDGYRFLDLIPQAELLIYAGLGHIPMEEDPHTTAGDVAAFLSQVKTPA